MLFLRFEGDSPKALTRSILRRTLTNELASKYVLRQDGQADKGTFENLSIFKLIKGEYLFEV